MTKKPIKNPFENPLVGMVTTLEAMKDNIMSNEEPKWRKDKFNDKLENGIIVDTVVGFDTGLWETGILTKGKWIIVEQYNNRTEAEKGHQTWVKTMTINPDKKLKDIFMEDLGI